MEEKLIAIIAEYRGVDASEISKDATFADIGLDSLDVAELAMQIEDSVGVSIEVSPEINTIAKLAEYIESKKN